jgi:hypothetical protein
VSDKESIMKTKFKGSIIGALFIVSSTLHAAAIVNVGTLPNTLPPSDDGSSAAVDIGFPINLFGATHTQLFVNNNGNVTFGTSLSAFTPFGLASTRTPIIAPFFADVDTSTPRPPATGTPGTVSFGQVTISGRRAFAVHWRNVGHYNSKNDKKNNFQLLLIDISDPNNADTAGDFVIIFNYNKIQWETGDASDGSNGFGGSSAIAGFSNGTGASGSFLELRGSAINGAFLDSNIATGLIHNRAPATHPSATAGRYIFEVIDGGIARADLAISMIADPKPAVIGQDLTFNIFVKNYGRSPTSVVVRNTLPPEVTLTRASPGCAISGQRVRCELGVLNRNQTATVAVVGTANTTNTIVNTARVVGTVFDPVVENNTVTANTDPSKCRGQLIGKSAPLSIVYDSTPTTAAVKAITLVLENPGSRGVEVTAINVLPGEPFTITGISGAALPIVVNGGQGVRFTVTTERAAGQLPSEATAPYFSTRIRCR